MARQRTAKSSSAAWSDAVSTWEKSVNGMANASMANDEFSGVMNQAMKLTLLMQQSLGNVMAVYLSAMNLPSRSDVAALGERLQSVELRIDRLTTAFERLADAVATAAPAASPASSERSAATQAAASAPAPGPAGVDAAKTVAPRPSPAKPMPPRTKRPPSRASDVTA